MSQRIWSDDMLDDFNIACGRFIKKPKQVIGRPPSTRNRHNNYGIISSMKVPLMMPKIHTLVSHVEDFIKLYRYWGCFSEECFEHFQNVSLSVRRRHAFNRSLGAQLVDDITYAWVLSSSRAQALRKTAEDRILAKNKRFKKRLFSKTVE